MEDQSKNPELKHEHANLLNAVQIQLRSQRASDILRGISQARQWLQKNAEDRQVYEILLDAVQENHEIREQVRNLLLEKMQKGSSGAEEALSLLPSTTQDLFADADDAYYAAEYDRAIQLYLQVLKRAPDDARAMQYLTKATDAKQSAGDSIEGLPRDAVQHYRRARSFMAAGDFLLAIQSLSAAVESAKERGLVYVDAEELLKIAQESLIAGEHKQRANRALEKEQWESALEIINKGLALELADDVIKAELHSLRNLVYAEIKLQKWGALKFFKSLVELKNAHRLAKGMIGQDNFLLNLIGKQLNQIRLTRITGLLVLIFAGLFLYFFVFGDIPIPPASLSTPAIPTNIVVDPTLPSTTSPPATITQILPTLAEELPTETLEPEFTFTPAPTPISIMGYGKLTMNVFPVEYLSGDAASTGILLYRKQYVTIVDSQYFQDSIWYKCIWEVDDVAGIGWIDGKYIQFVPPPAPEP